ncbi:hypothetical protein [Actinocatenispora rupis]|uniref:Uncharacterized protein n=1 Tax=Actinocatenispora rupis TaxID=519421 RepID=A0A8J3J0Z6_9ACTN|nr:hypothetical protein [Actinocatenispora rupis]GID13781.1 hypothetical protein Aru02nite_46700 [Actinocatenispora rupis]
MRRVAPVLPTDRVVRIAVLVLVGVALVAGTAAIWYGVVTTVDPATHEPPMYAPPSADPALSGMPSAP